MKLLRLSLRPVRLPLKERWVTARGVLEAREGYLVFAHTAEGLNGVGEALPLPSSGTESLAECQRALDAARELEGVVFKSVSGLQRRLDALLPLELAPCARFGLETALLDALAQERGEPLARLLTTRALPQVRVNAVLDAESDAARRTKQLREQGFTSVKLKVGLKDDAARVRAVRDALGPTAELKLDANGAYSATEAPAALEAFAASRPSYCEDPVAAPTRLSGTPVPVAADAWLAVPSQRKAVLERRLADVLVLKPAVVGGVLRAQALAVEARNQGMACAVTTTLEGVVGRLAALHLAATLPNTHAAGLATAELLKTDHALDPAPVRNGQMQVPEGGGLGVEVSP